MPSVFVALSSVVPSSLFAIVTLFSFAGVFIVVVFPPIVTLLLVPPLSSEMILLLYAVPSDVTPSCDTLTLPELSTRTVALPSTLT